MHSSTSPTRATGRLALARCACKSPNREHSGDLDQEGKGVRLEAARSCRNEQTERMMANHLVLHSSRSSRKSGGKYMSVFLDALLQWSCAGWYVNHAGRDETVSAKTQGNVEGSRIERSPSLRSTSGVQPKSCPIRSLASQEPKTSPTRRGARCTSTADPKPPRPQSATG